MKLTIDSKTFRDPLMLMGVLVSLACLTLVAWYVIQFLYDFVQQLVSLAPSNSLTMR